MQIAQVIPLDSILFAIITYYHWTLEYIYYTIFTVWIF